MRHNPTLLIGLLLVLLQFLGGLGSVDVARGDDKAKSNDLGTALRGDEPKAERAVLEARGHLVPGSRVTVSPKVAGQVVELLIKEGERVNAGDLLARLDGEGYEAALRVARARLELAAAELAKAREGAGKADLAIAEARVQVAQAEVARAQYRLGGTAVRAPVDGVVLAVRAGVGTRANPRGQAGVCDLADLGALEVEARVPEQDLAKVARGHACGIQVDAVPGATYRGRVVRLPPAADRGRGPAVVLVRLERPEGGAPLLPELTVTIRFMANE